MSKQYDSVDALVDDIKAPQVGEAYYKLRVKDLEDETEQLRAQIEAIESYAREIGGKWLQAEGKTVLEMLQSVHNAAKDINASCHAQMDILRANLVEAECSRVKMQKLLQSAVDSDNRKYGWPFAIWRQFINRSKQILADAKSSTRMEISNQNDASVRCQFAEYEKLRAELKTRAIEIMELGTKLEACELDKAELRAQVEALDKEVVGLCCQEGKLEARNHRLSKALSEITGLLEEPDFGTGQTVRLIKSKANAALTAS